MVNLAGQVWVCGWCHLRPGLRDLQERLGVAGHWPAFLLTGADFKTKGARVCLSGRQCLSSEPKAWPSVQHYAPPPAPQKRLSMRKAHCG